MHQIYLLALAFNRAPEPPGPRSRAELAREEQAFYDAYPHGAPGRSRARRWAPLALVVVLSATLAALAQVFER